MQSLYFIITVPTDGLAPHGARPSAGTVSGSDYKKTHVLCQITLAIIDFLSHHFRSDGIIQSCP